MKNNPDLFNAILSKASGAILEGLMGELSRSFTSDRNSPRRGFEDDTYDRQSTGAIRTQLHDLVDELDPDTLRKVYDVAQAFRHNQPIRKSRKGGRR